ncbi:MAG: hypothetical protein QOD99_1366 [Chthoniobacter sp.]|jgi:D-alanyl-D-alanine carboxypeptidase (penicillin-binding protein 5/6)|nr:hypothetical protein [Chthoniobacter sp.]
MRRFRLFLGLLCTVALCFDASAATAKKGSTPKKKAASAPAQQKPAEPKTGPGGVPIVRAASVMVIDARTGEILYEKNADQHRPPASTQKLLTALLVVEAGNLDRSVTAQVEDTFAEPVKLNIQPGDTYRRLDLLEVLLVHSTNDVARCLARDNAGSVDAFAEKMNRKAGELGATDSHFVNPNGLPAPGQYSTARDMSRIAFAAYQNRTIRSIVCLRELQFHYADGRVRKFDNTNKVLRSFALCNGMKTGYTEAAGHCLISSASNGSREVISVVLGDNDAVWRDSYALLVWGLSSGERIGARD